MTLATLFLTALAIALTIAIVLLALAVFSLRARLLLVESMAHTHPSDRALLTSRKPMTDEEVAAVKERFSHAVANDKPVELVDVGDLRKLGVNYHRVGSETLTGVSSPLPARRHAGFAGDGAAAGGSAAAPTPSVMFTGPRAPRGVHRA